MKYVDFQRQLLPFHVFSVSDIKKKEVGFDTRRLVEWQRKNYIQKIINRWYIFSDTKITEEFLFLVANEIYSPSYVSFESALSFHGLIPEGVFSTISATSKKTEKFETELGTFFYRHLKPDLMFGYRLEPVNNRFYKVAEPEKAILDYLYLHPSMKEFDDFEEWRINRYLLKEIFDKEKFERYLVLFGGKKLTVRCKAFLKYISHA